MAGKSWTAEDIERWRKKQEENTSEKTWTAEDINQWKRKQEENTSAKTESFDSVKKDTTIPKLEGTKQSATQARTADSKMSREEIKQTRKESKEWLKDYGKKLRKGEISQEQAAKDLLNADSEYYKMQEAYNKSNPLSAFALGLTSGMPLFDLVAESAADKGNLNAELFVKNRDSAKEQNKGATIAGNLAGTAASYTALNPLITKIPVLNKATEKAAEGLSKLPVLRKVGAEPIKNILSDMAVDVSLDTIPMIAKDVQEEKSAGEIAKDTALNIVGNLAGNILGESAPAILKTIMDKRANGAEKVAKNSLEQATEAIIEKADDMAETLPVETKNIDDIGIASAEADPLANVQNAPHSSLANSLSENYANDKNIQINSSVQTKLTNLEKQMKKIVNWYGDDAAKAEFAEFQNALNQFEETGSIDDFRRVWELADRLDQSMQGKTYTTKDVLNKNGSLKRKGVTYTYGDNASVEIAMEDAMDELYTMKNTSNNMTEVKPENVPVKTTSDEIPYLRTEGTGKLKEESYSGNIGKGG